MNSNILSVLIIASHCYSNGFGCKTPAFQEFKYRLKGTSTTTISNPSVPVVPYPPAIYWWRCIDVDSCKSFCAASESEKETPCPANQITEIKPTPFGGNRENCENRTFAKTGNMPTSWILTTCLFSSFSFQLLELSNGTLLINASDSTVLFNSSLTNNSLKFNGKTERNQIIFIPSSALTASFKICYNISERSFPIVSTERVPGTTLSILSTSTASSEATSPAMTATIRDLISATPEHSNCGYSMYTNDNISRASISSYDGRQALDGEHPWLVFLQVWTSVAFNGFVDVLDCIGFLVSPNFVLTIITKCCSQAVDEPRRFTVFMGYNLRLSNRFEYAAAAEAIYLHPLFNNATYQYDFCLIRIPTVQISKYVQPLCVQTSCNEEPCPIGSMLTVASFPSPRPGIIGQMPNVQVGKDVLRPGSICKATDPAFDLNLFFCLGETKEHYITPADIGCPAICCVNNKAIAVGSYYFENNHQFPQTNGVMVFGRLCWASPWIFSVTSQQPVSTPFPPIAPNRNSCGEPGNNGNPFPWQVVISLHSKDEFYEGVLIDAQWVLTTEHVCSEATMATDFRIYIGETSDGNYSYSNLALDYIIHPGYNELTIFDFCLVRIPHVPFGIQPVCLPANCDAENECQTGQMVTVSSLVDPNTLSIRSAIKSSQYAVTDSVTCIQGTDYFMDQTIMTCINNRAISCSTGSSAVCSIRGKSVLQGIFSQPYVEACAQVGVTRMFGRVCRVRDWLDSYINSPALSTTTA